MPSRDYTPTHATRMRIGSDIIEACRADALTVSQLRKRVRGDTAVITAAVRQLATRPFRYTVPAAAGRWEVELRLAPEERSSVSLVPPDWLGSGWKLHSVSQWDRSYMLVCWERC